MRSLPIVVLLAACSKEATFDEPVRIELTSPTYGEFFGDDDILVTGRVIPHYGRVKVEGVDVETDANGYFEAHVPFEDRFRNVDVEAAAGGTYAKARVPVFDGHDPAVTFPDGVTMRITPDGLDRLGEPLGAQIDAIGWADQLEAALPTLEQSGFTMVPTGITHSPSTVELRPAVGGLDTTIALHDVTVGYDLSFDFFGTPVAGHMDLGFGDIEIGAKAIPDVDADGMLSIGMSDAIVTLDEPTVVIEGLEDFEWILDLVVELAMDWIVEPLGELILDLALDQFGTIPLGGPFAFSQDLLGTPLNLQLSNVWGDLSGFGMGVQVGIGEELSTDPLAMPAPGAEAAPVHLAVGLHEGLLQTVVAGGMLDMLSQDIQLPGTIGELIGTGIRALPGGETAPAGDGWCLSLEPGEAKVVRLQEGIDPFATLYLPDMKVHVGVSQSGFCVPWIDASMAAKVGLKVTDGTTVGVDIEFVEGALEYYGATSDYDETAVTDGLAGFMNGAMGLLGGMVSFDLADMLGGADPTGGMLGDVQPAVVSCHPLPDAQGNEVEGLYSLGIQLWAPVE